MSSIGARIKERRHEIGVSAETLAMLINKSPATIYRYEAGGIEKVPADILSTISVALRTTPAFLMGWTDDPSPGSNNSGELFNRVVIYTRDGAQHDYTLTDAQISAILIVLDNMK